jgi:Ca2+-transporting ATPase
MNHWLWAAIAGSLVLQVLVIYVPLLQRSFGTVGLTVEDWMLCLTIASTVLWLREGSKLIGRQQRR